MNGTVIKKLNRSANTHTHPVTLQVSHLDLQQWEISKDLQVVFVPFQCVSVALYSLIVLLVRPLEQTVHMPTWKCHVKDKQGKLFAKRNKTRELMTVSSVPRTIAKIHKIFCVWAPGHNGSTIPGTTQEVYMFLFILWGERR